MYKHCLKRIFDFLIALTAILCLSPLLVVVTIWLHFANKGAGAFFTQERPGKGEKIFRVIKFKSMTDERDEKGNLLPDEKRLTPIGNFIRKTSIDELPQLFNILKGDMSIVGNRPLPLYEAEKLTADSSIDRFMAPAGLTGLWQVEDRGRGGAMSAEERKQLDIEYGQTYSFALDMKIIFRTLFAFVQKENV